MSMVNDKQPFVLRCSVLYCFECFLYNNELGQSQIIATLLPSSTEVSQITGESVTASPAWWRVYYTISQKRQDWNYWWVNRYCVVTLNPHCSVFVAISESWSGDLFYFLKKNLPVSLCCLVTGSIIIRILVLWQVYAVCKWVHRLTRLKWPIYQYIAHNLITSSVFII